MEIGSPLAMCRDELVWVQIVFWPGGLLITYLIAKHNSFGLKDALLAAVGLKKFNRSLLINFVSFVAMAGTLGFAAWILQNCLN